MYVRFLLCLSLSCEKICERRASFVYMYLQSHQEHFSFNGQVICFFFFFLAPDRNKELIQLVVCTALEGGAAVNSNILQQSKNEMGVRSETVMGKQS